jgi:hypothetical protein
MHIDELIEQQKNKDSGITKPRKRYALKIILLTSAILIVTLTIITILLLHKPSGFEPPEMIKDKQVSKYLTHVITQQLYNGAQRGEPFDLVVAEQGITDVVARMGWPKQLGEISFQVPQVKFDTGKIILRGTINIENLDLFVVVEGSAWIDKQKLMHLNVRKVKVGAVSLTTVAKLVAQALYNDETARRQIDADDWESKIMEALLRNKPFEPVFEIDKSMIRIDEIAIQSQEVAIHFVPHKQ